MNDATTTPFPTSTTHFQTYTVTAETTDNSELLLEVVLPLVFAAICLCFCMQMVVLYVAYRLFGKRSTYEFEGDDDKMYPSDHPHYNSRYDFGRLRLNARNLSILSDASTVFQELTPVSVPYVSNKDKHTGTERGSLSPSPEEHEVEEAESSSTLGVAGVAPAGVTVSPPDSPVSPCSDTPLMDTLKDTHRTIIPTPTKAAPTKQGVSTQLLRHIHHRNILKMFRGQELHSDEEESSSFLTVVHQRNMETAMAMSPYARPSDL